VCGVAHARLVFGVAAGLRLHHSPRGEHVLAWHKHAGRALPSLASATGHAATRRQAAPLQYFVSRAAVRMSRGGRKASHGMRTRERERARERKHARDSVRESGRARESERAREKESARARDRARERVRARASERMGECVCVCE
jgi:hypothetical protein